MNPRLPLRAWYYLRLGFSGYLGFTLALLNFIILADQFLLNRILPIPFIASALLIGGSILPLAILLGYVHLKRSGAYQAEMDLSVESNPWYYKAMPGKERGYQWPLMVFQMGQTEKLMQTLNDLAEVNHLRPPYSVEDFQGIRRFREQASRLAQGEILR